MKFKLQQLKFFTPAVLLSFSTCQHADKPKEQQNDRQKDNSPNIILLFVDDMGYADVQGFGIDSIETPHLKKMADEGMKFTDFYVPAASSAPSRNALLTGCYPARNYVSPDKPENAVENLTLMKNIEKDEVHPVDWKMMQKVLKKHPEAKLARHTWGLPKSEMTIPEMLKQKEYNTVMYGKWHLGEAERFHPVKHGFDQYWGVPQSISVRAPHDYHPWMVENKVYFPNQPLYENDSIIEFQTDSSLLTQKYTHRAVDYIKSHQNKPFFMFLSYMMPHVPIGTPEEFKGISGKGLYADVVMEIDWSVGKILNTLKENNLDKNTLVVFTSDNGPWLAYGEHAGQAKPLREGKGTYFEGGVREPTLMWWPGTIPAGSVCNQPAMTIDLMPTFAEITGTELTENKIDGRSILHLMKKTDAESTQQPYYFFNMGNFAKYGDLVAIRKGDWKLFFPYQYKTLDGKPGGKYGVPVSMDTDSIGLALFNLRKDVGEQNNVINQYPEIAEELKKLGREFESDVKQNQRGVDWITRD